MSLSHDRPVVWHVTIWMSHVIHMNDSCYTHDESITRQAWWVSSLCDMTHSNVWHESHRCVSIYYPSCNFTFWPCCVLLPILALTRDTSHTKSSCPGMPNCIACPSPCLFIAAAVMSTFQITRTYKSLLRDNCTHTIMMWSWPAMAPMRFPEVSMWSSYCSSEIFC